MEYTHILFFFGWTIKTCNFSALKEHADNLLQLC